MNQHPSYQIYRLMRRIRIWEGAEEQYIRVFTMLMQRV